MTWKSSLSIVLTILLITSVIASQESEDSSSKKKSFVCNKIEASLLQQTTKGVPEGVTDALISFTSSPTSIINSISLRKFGTRADKISSLVVALEENAEEDQKQVIQDFLVPNNIAFHPIWISNQLLVENVTYGELLRLCEFPQVKGIEENREIEMDDVLDLRVQQVRREDYEVEWGIRMVRAEEALDLLDRNNVPLTEVRVGIIDTGIRRTHETLNDSYYGEYGWFDPYEMTDIPTDGNGHGTHVAGTILGQKGIGVFPQAKWMGCRGCYTNTCSIATLLLCGQFFVCPTLTNMTRPDCGHAPHIVSNSWGGGSRASPWYNAVIDAWHLAGIIPVFSGGNTGPNCSTVASPGDRHVISVGATDSADTIAYFSSRGPTADTNETKPDFSAPGHLVLSAWMGADNQYATASGTSMAAPHVTGVIAIMKSVRPDLTYDEIKMLLQAGVDTQSLIPQNIICGGTPDYIFPNNFYGYGRVNALKSLVTLLSNGPLPTVPTTTTTTPTNNSSAVGWVGNGGSFLTLTVGISVSSMRFLSW